MRRRFDAHQSELQPRFNQLATLPTPVSSSSSSNPAEYPSVRSVSPSHWAVSSGTGSVYILETTLPTDSAFSGQTIARYDLLPKPGSEPCAFLLQAAHLISPTDCRLLLTRSIIPPNAGKVRTQTTAFELLEVILDPTKRNSVDATIAEPLDVRWRLVGRDLPFWCAWSGSGWQILSGEQYEVDVDEDKRANLKRELLQREQDERVARLGIGASLSFSDPVKTNGDHSSPAAFHPYSWTQNSESLSVSIPFPPNTERSDISFGITSDTFSLSLSPSSAVSAEGSLERFLINPKRRFWTDIDIAASTMSFNYGKSVLELDLVKAEPHNRWPSVFTKLDDNNEDEAVNETISASELAVAREILSNTRDRQPLEPEGNHSTIPGLLREEIDFDLEDEEDSGETSDMVIGDSSGGGKVGRDILVGFVQDGVASWSKSPASILSTPLDHSGMIVKSAVDGLIFKPPVSAKPVTTPWTHISTSPALAFVISSKRDLRVVRHLTSSSGTTVLAFDAGSSLTASGNVYVYYPPVSRTLAKQGVVRISGAERGAVLGVGCLEVEGRKVVVALCEKVLVVLQGVV